MSEQKKKISGDVIPFNLNDPSPIDITQTSQHAIINRKDGNGGGSDMDKYATREELKHTQEILSEKINHRSDVIEEKIAGVKSQIENSNKLLYWILGIFGAVFTGLLVALLTK